MGVGLEMSGGRFEGDSNYLGIYFFNIDPDFAR
jgi:hypothetical protein